MDNQINGLKLIPLKIFKDERGSLLHIFNPANHLKKNFCEVYASETNSGVIKAWKKHTELSQNLCAITGQIKLVIFDYREQSSTYKNFFEIILSRDNYYLVHIPKQVWYGFQCISQEKAILINCIDKPYDPKQSISCSLEELPFSYEW